MMNGYKMKPCPFCGGSAEFTIKSSSARGATRGWAFGIYCTSCHVATPKNDYLFEIQFNKLGGTSIIVDERQAAVDAWNTRAEPRRADEDDEDY